MFNHTETLQTEEQTKKCLRFWEKAAILCWDSLLQAMNPEMRPQVRSICGFGHSSSHADTLCANCALQTAFPGAVVKYPHVALADLLKDREIQAQSFCSFTSSFIYDTQKQF